MGEDRAGIRNAPFRARSWVRRTAKALRAAPEIWGELAKALEKKERSAGTE